jgi:hypothetical protein
VDANGDVSITDALSLLSSLFQGGAPPACDDAADTNDDGEVDVSDGVVILLHLFAGAGDLPEPSDACGLDRTDDALRCGGSGCE